MKRNGSKLGFSVVVAVVFALMAGGASVRGDLVRQMVARWKRRQQARATYAALRALDAHTLRDLGFHRCELMSVAAEVAGDADSTRTRLVRSEPGGAI